MKAKIPTVAAVHVYWPVCPQNTLWNNHDICAGPSRERCYKHVLPSTNRKNLKFRVLSLCGETLQIAIKKRKQRLNQIEGVIVPSNFMKSKLIEEGINPDKINVIYNGISVEPPMISERSAEGYSIHGFYR